jgi:hypothetical protein
MKKYNEIFLKNELRTIFGKKWINFWILLAVFLLTIGSLCFSRAGLDFLSKKMNDPFIKWVQVKEQGDFVNFQKDILAGTTKDKFSISTIESNNFILEYVFTADFKKWRVEGRTIAQNSQLLDKILDKENTIVKRQKEISQNDFGWIVTKDLMSNLGYEDENNYPLFINYTYPGNMENIDSMGITNFDGFIVIPIPIIAVVRQLPDLLDFITPSYFKQQLESHSNPFNISMHDIYYQDLILVVENPTQAIEEKISKQLSNSGLSYDEDWNATTDNFAQSLRDATKYRIIVRDSNVKLLNLLADEICNDPNIYRYYNYEFDRGFQLTPDYMSFMFDDLNKVQNFAKWAKNPYGVRIDMAQIEAKNNFSIFNQLANGLCIAIIAISVLFIIIFLWFLIKSHFQKISKNLGTIMAFGLDNRSIIRIYLAVFMALVFFALTVATVLLLVTQYTFAFFGFVRENAMPYLNMFDIWVISALGGILILSVIVTLFSMNTKLKATPGDLIFERNN